MKAFLLAAGKGKRLLPLTKETPKPLVKVGGISLIERNLYNLKKANVLEVIINIHHLGEKIIKLLGDGSKYGLKISYSIEGQLLGTGGGIQKSIHEFADPFIVLSSDIWTDFDFSGLKLKRNLLAHMVLVPNTSSNPEGDVSLINGFVKQKQPSEHYTFSGISIVSPKLFNYPNDRELGLWSEILKPASEKGLVSGELYKGKFENLNTIDDIERLDASLSAE